MAKARLYKMVNPGVIKRGGITVKVGDKTITQPTINFSKNIIMTSFKFTGIQLILYPKYLCKVGEELINCGYSMTQYLPKKLNVINNYLPILF